MAIFKSLAYVSTCVLGICFSEGASAKEIQATRNFFRITVDLVYKGQPTQISYPVSCHGNVTRQRDGDTSYDGKSIVPFAFGQKVSSGGALIVETPDFCSEIWSSDSDKAEFRIPPDYNPPIIQFEDSNNPWFGIAYIGKVAYQSPHSVMQFKGSRIERITDLEWLEWRKANPEANWLTWDNLGLNRNWFKRVVWNPGDRHIPTVCSFGSVLRFPEEVRDAIRPYWPDKSPYLWKSEKAYWVMIEKRGSRMKHKNSPPDILFSGHPGWEYGRTLISPMPSRYPAVSDFSMNELQQDGTVDPAKITDGEYLPKGRWKGPAGNVIKRSADLMRDDYEGFGFCNESHKVDIASWNRAFGNLGGIDSVNGKPVDGESVHPKWENGGGFIKDEAYISFGQIILFGKGGGL